MVELNVRRRARIAILTSHSLRPTSSGGQTLSIFSAKRRWRAPGVRKSLARGRTTPPRDFNHLLPQRVHKRHWLIRIPGTTRGVHSRAKHTSPMSRIELLRRVFSSSERTNFFICMLFFSPSERALTHFSHVPRRLPGSERIFPNTHILAVPQKRRRNEQRRNSG